MSAQDRSAANRSDPADGVRVSAGSDHRTSGVSTSSAAPVCRHGVSTAHPDKNIAGRAKDCIDKGSILAEITRERERQDAKWGGQPGVDRRDDHTYAAVLGEEFGECCKAWLERDTVSLREELIQVASVAVAWIEELDNTMGAPRAA